MKALQLREPELGNESFNEGRNSALNNSSCDPNDPAEDENNGQPLTIDSPQQLTSSEREILRQSEEAFIQVRQTWAHWKLVGAGLLVLRDLAMRETRCTAVKSKRYKDRLHELLEQRVYCSKKMKPTARKALLKCAELSPELDEWYEHLDDDRRLRLNHPERVLRAFRESQTHKSAGRQSRRVHLEAEVEKVQREAATAVSRRDAKIEELQQQIDQPREQAYGAIGEDTESDVHSIVRYVVTKCKTEQRIQDVIDGLNRYLEQRES